MAQKSRQELQRKKMILMPISFNDFANRYSGFMNNPVQTLLQNNVNIPQNMQNPQSIVQHLMDSGQMTQQQFNQLQDIAKRIQQNPRFVQMFGHK